MRIKPLTGQVLIFLIPRDRKDGSIHLPDTDDPERKPVRKGIVKAMGPWKRLKNGMGMLPPFGIGATVLVSEYHGHKLNRNIGEYLRLVRSDDVLAVLTNDGDGDNV